MSSIAKLSALAQAVASMRETRPNWSLRGKTVVITGAGSGIGRALAQEAARRGALLALSDVDTDGMAETEQLVRELGATTVLTSRLDVSERAHVEEYARSVAAELGVINAVINNAGIAYIGTVQQADYKHMEKVMDIDYWGVVHGSKEFLPYLIESGDGHLVNISSLFGIVSMPSQSAYNAAKFAVRGFTEALRVEMLTDKLPVDVSCVHPGGVKTAVARNAMGAEGVNVKAVARNFDRKLTPTTPEDAATIILDGVEKRSPRILVGPDAKLLNTLHRVVGARYQELIAAGSARTGYTKS